MVVHHDKSGQRISVREFHVIMRATQCFFTTANMVVALRFQRVSFHEFWVTMGATEWLVTLKMVMLRSQRVSICEF